MPSLKVSSRNLISPLPEDILTVLSAPNAEFSTETREELLYNKEKLLANGDKWEPELAAAIRADAPYR